MEYEELDWGTSNTITTALPSVALVAQSYEQSFSSAASSTPAAVDERTQVNTSYHYVLFHLSFNAFTGSIEQQFIHT